MQLKKQKIKTKPNKLNNPKNINPQIYIYIYIYINIY